MTSGHVEIHDPLSQPNGHSGGTQHNSESTPNMEDTVEFRVLMVYATRRRPHQEDDSNARTSPAAVSGEDDANGNVTTPSNTLIHDEKKEKGEKKKKKKKLLKGLSKIFSCTRPQTNDEVEQQQQPTDPADEFPNRCFQPTDEPEKEEEEKEEEEKKVEEVVIRLMELADEIELTPPELETDTSGDVEKIVALLLRETGDKWNEKVLKDANIKVELFSDYSFFRTLINTFLIHVGLKTSNPHSPGPQASPKTQMAVMCEVTARLSSVLPVNGLLNHGARYIQDYFSPWVQEQGGYEAVFKETEEVD